MRELTGRPNTAVASPRAGAGAPPPVRHLAPFCSWPAAVVCTHFCEAKPVEQGSADNVSSGLTVTHALGLNTERKLPSFCSVNWKCE